MTTELIPCMNCGGSGEDVLLEYEWEGEHKVGCWLICECGLSLWASTEEEVRAMWNKGGQGCAVALATAQAESAELQAKLDAVPWKQVLECATLAEDDPDYRDDGAAVIIYLEMHRPMKEPQP